MHACEQAERSCEGLRGDVTPGGSVVAGAERHAGRAQRAQRDLPLVLFVLFLALGAAPISPP